MKTPLEYEEHVPDGLKHPLLVVVVECIDTDDCAVDNLGRRLLTSLQTM